MASGGHSSSRCAGLSLSRPLLLRSTGSRRAGSAVAAHGPTCSASCGIFPDQGSNPCPLHWQADSQPLRHRGSLGHYLLRKEWEGTWRGFPGNKEGVLRAGECSEHTVRTCRESWEGNKQGLKIVAQTVGRMLPMSSI